MFRPDSWLVILSHLPIFTAIHKFFRWLHRTVAFWKDESELYDTSLWVRRILASGKGQSEDRD